MPKGRKGLPPLDYLLAFQVTGKTGSFTLASKELNISESSISRKAVSYTHLTLPTILRV